MKGIRTFSRGGIHLSDKKDVTAKSPIRNVPLPAIALVPFSQHMGAPAKPVVRIGDHVQEAQIIGESVGFVSAMVHSPIPGTVKDIRQICLPNGVKTAAAVIELDGEFSRSGKSIKRRDWKSLSGTQILKIIKNHGVVGQGGVAFPSHIKFSIPKGRTCEVILVNATECEPYLSADYRLILERSQDLVEGIRIVQKILSPKRIVIAIEADKSREVESLLNGDDGIEIMPLKMKYPQGAEKNLIEAVLNREVPSGRLPIEIGVVSSNVGTLVSICAAVRDDTPLIERIITVAGGAVREPGNIRVRIGSSVRDIIEECGGFSQTPKTLVSGGPMTGFAFDDLETPVTKDSRGILALSDRESVSLEPTACISCGRCIDSCPMGLEPNLIFKNIEHKNWDKAEKIGLKDCVYCGACAYSCPSHIPLVSLFRTARDQLSTGRNY